MITTFNTEFRVLRKSEVSFERILVCNVIEKLAEHGKHHYALADINGFKVVLP